METADRGGAWSCWLRRGNYSALQRMFPSPYFYHQACWAAWTALRRRRPLPPCTAACTGLLPRPIPSCSGPWCPECSSGLGPGGQPALNPLSNPIPGTPHPPVKSEPADPPDPSPTRTAVPPLPQPGSLAPCTVYQEAKK